MTEANANQKSLQAPIPPQIAGNLLELLRRVKGLDGVEAIAWVEAYQYVTQFAPPPQAGAPFGGLPPKR